MSDKPNPNGVRLLKDLWLPGLRGDAARYNDPDWLKSGKSPPESIFTKLKDIDVIRRSGKS